MNLIEIITKQKELDKKINEAHDLSNLDISKKMIIALYVEIAELANEIQSFKYWKKNKNINIESIHEEYADGLHFIMSFAIELKANTSINSQIINNDMNDQIIELFRSVGIFEKKQTKENIEKIISIYLGLGALLKMSEETIKESYFRKNEINLARIKNNY